MEQKWWHNKVAYQIYPKSFCDSNGDGIGDIQGIISKLDYLKSLGVDIIWLSPIYKSPLADQGYDISDYYDIDPRFGTMADFDELLAEASARDMYIVMDLVVNHCSDEHEWFKKACQDPDGEYGKYFYILDYDGTHLPCNWRSYFGGSVWETLPGHPDKVYLHSFHKKQPDLNWENPALRQEIYKMMNWWLDKGLGGFRIDAIINIKKVPEFVDYPADRPDGTSMITNMLADAHGIGKFLREMRDECFAPHDAFSVGEVFDSRPEELLEFIGPDGYFSSMFDFRTHLLDYQGVEITPARYINAIYESQAALDGHGFYSNIIENHDEPRGVSHYISDADRNDRSKKLLGLIQFMTPGLPFIYQGQEIGMENYPWTSIDEIDDVAGRNDYAMALEDGLTPEQALAKAAPGCRDNARTPVQWDDSEQAGFTTGKPWLPVNPNKATINVASQIDDPDSVWSFYQELAALRKSEEYGQAIVYGDFTVIDQPDDTLMAFLRQTEDTSLLVLANFKGQPIELTHEYTVKEILITNTDELMLAPGCLRLGAYGAVVLAI